MILHLKEHISKEDANKIASKIRAFHITRNNKQIIVTSSLIKEIPSEINDLVDEYWTFSNDIQLSSKIYQPKTTTVKIGDIEIGGNTNNTLVIAGPCSVESELQIIESSKMLKKMGLTSLRGGCYKPRSSPYTFQGLELEGLKLLNQMKSEFGLNIITEVKDATHVDEIIEYSDVIQIGTKAMYDQGILRACSKIRKPILIKRGFGSNLQEFIQAAEFILSGGNPNVILCERGIRTFETKTRFTLDLCGVSFIKQHINLPIIVDPSHAMGYAYGIPDLTRAIVAMGVDGVLIEVHPNPKMAKSDAFQQLNHEEFNKLYKSLIPIASAIGRNLI